MANCPYCKSKLSRKLVKSIRLDGLKWYEYSREPFFKTVCSLCSKEIVRDYNQRWYYQLSSVLILFSFIYSMFFYEYEEGATLIKAFLILLLIIAGLVSTKQWTDYEYVTLQDQKNKAIKKLKKEANKNLENPVHVYDYMEKYQLSYNEVKALISSGEITAWGGTEEYSVFIDETIQGQKLPFTSFIRTG